MSDPLASFKEAKTEVMENQSDIREFMDQVISAIERNDQRRVYELFGSGDAMAFNRNYLKRFFKEQDFCPAEVREIRKITRSVNHEVFYEALVSSTRRNKGYLFTIEGSDGNFRVAYLVEQGNGKTTFQPPKHD